MSLSTQKFITVPVIEEVKLETLKFCETLKKNRTKSSEKYPLNGCTDRLPVKSRVVFLYR